MTSDLMAEPVAFPLTIDTSTDLPVVFTGLVVDDDHRTVQLAKLPTLPAWPETGEDDEARVADAGGVAAAGGRVFWIDRASNTVNMRACNGSSAPIGCFGGDAWGELVGIAASRTRVFITDREYGRVVAVAADNGQLIDLWHGLDEPGDLAIGEDRNAYVIVSAGIARLTTSGRWALLAAIDNALSVVMVGRRLLVTTGGAPPQLVAVDSRSGEIEPVGLHPTLAGPWLVQHTDGLLLLANPAFGSVHAFDLASLSYLGELSEPGVGFTNLTVDDCGQIWFTDGSSVGNAGPARLVQHGQLQVGPLALPVNPDGTGIKQLRLKIRGRFEPGLVDATIVFSPPGPGGADVSPTITRLEDRLIEVPHLARTAKVIVTLFAPADANAHSLGPTLKSIELHADEPGLLEYLPHIYRAQGDPGAFLDPYLRLLASGNDDVVDALEDLVQQFNPATAEDRDGAKWLDWLASWTDAMIDESWPTARRRRVVANAFEANGRRGTAEAMRDRIGLELELDATIIEPGDLASVWVLGDESAELGMTSMTSAAPADGSIVGATAHVDRSHLIGPGDVGAPLFGDLAHRFHVIVGSLGLDEDRAAQLRTIIEREKPAHTHAHICCPDPGFRLGLGGRIGIDLVVAAPARPNRVDGLDGFDASPDSLRLDAGPALILS